jgi:hypothetical protein
MTDRGEPAERKQSRVSRLAKSNREAFGRARARAAETRAKLEHSITARDEWKEIQERAEESQVGQGPLVPVEPQMEVEQEDWVYQTVDDETLEALSHRVVLHTSAGERKVLFQTKNLDEAVDCASRIVEFADGTVLVETIDP